MKKSAFTILELSITLSVIALITALISAGIGMRNYSNLRAIIGEIQYYQAAYNTFNTQYLFPPGDFPGAYNTTTSTTLWPSVASCNSAACNGNGDGSISWAPETFLAWLHLQLAGIIIGSYSGIGAGSGNWAVIGTNVPASKYNGACYHMEKCIGQSWCSFHSANVLSLGGPTTVAISSNCAMGVIAKVDAYNIDSKIDDGMPITGIVRVRADGWPSPPNNLCATGTTTTSTYNFSVSPQTGCALVLSM